VSTSRLAAAASLPLGQRLGWDDYFLMLAEAAATRSTCIRRRVGCVLVSEKSLLVSGYNGGLPKTPHCAAGGCPRAQGDLEPGTLNDNDPELACIALHAEQNAVARLRHRPASPITAYVTHTPCYTCAKLLLAAGIEEIVAAESYPGFEETREFIKGNGARIRLLDDIELVPV
jgi:dCMP deaminase